MAPDWTQTATITQATAGPGGRRGRTGPRRWRFSRISASERATLGGTASPTKSLRVQLGLSSWPSHSRKIAARSTPGAIRQA